MLPLLSDKLLGVLPLGPQEGLLLLLCYQALSEQPHFVESIYRPFSSRSPSHSFPHGRPAVSCLFLKLIHSDNPFCKTTSDSYAFQ